MRRAHARQRHNLPAQRTRLIGREHDLVELAALADPSLFPAGRSALGPLSEDYRGRGPLIFHDLGRDQRRQRFSRKALESAGAPALAYRS